MNKSSKKIINRKHFVLEAWLASPGSIYKFGIQAFPRRGQPHSFVVRLSEEFIEDEIDDNKRKEYLERIALKVTENHIEDMMELNKNEIINSIRWWFKEAKNQLENEQK